MDLHEYLQLEGYTDLQMKAGVLCGISLFCYTTGLVVGLAPMGYTKRYCFEHEADARSALDAWDGQGHPSGPWIKCKGAGIDLLNPNWTEDGPQRIDREHPP